MFGLKGIYILKCDIDYTEYRVSRWWDQYKYLRSMGNIDEEIQLPELPHFIRLRLKIYRLKDRLTKVLKNIERRIRPVNLKRLMKQLEKDIENKEFPDNSVRYGWEIDEGEWEQW